MAGVSEERVTRVQHWTEKLFSFVTTRNPAFRFEAGEFTMLGLHVEGRPLLRAYSMVSASYDDELEFLSIKVPDGALTSRLQHLKRDDIVLVGSKATGTLVVSNLWPGRRLYLLATGTGLAPFMSIIKCPETYERFEQVILVHGCRSPRELVYRDVITGALRQHELLGEYVRERLVYYPTVTREKFVNQGRITDLMTSGRLFSDLGLPPPEPETDRFMLCGNPAMLHDARTILEAGGFKGCGQGELGHFTLERAFAEQ